MSHILVIEQSLNGLQFGLMLFLLAAGLTLVFGIMDMVNLAHGSLYMVGAYLIATVCAAADFGVWGRTEWRRDAGCLGAGLRDDRRLGRGVHGSGAAATGGGARRT